MVIFLTYEEVCNYIEEIPKFTVKHSPEHTKRLLACEACPVANFEKLFLVIYIVSFLDIKFCYFEERSYFCEKYNYKSNH